MHVRGSSETLVPATDELIEIARRSGARVHHSHLEAVGEPYWPVVARVLEAEDRARAEGLRISHDMFPYTRAATMMSAIFPPWALDGGIDVLLLRLADPATRERIRHDIATTRPKWPPWTDGGWPHNLVEAVGWDGVVLASVRSASSRQVGENLAEIATASDRDPLDVVAELMLSERGQVGQLVDEISGRDGEESVLHSIFAHPAAAVVSDAEDYGRGAPHPAHAGAFARALRIARETGAPTLEEAVHRMTGYPAELLGVSERGVIHVGAAADLVVFDRQRIRDAATWKHPRRAATGMPYVILNGTPVVVDGHPTDRHPGHVLRRRS
jgi:N-acyl-D-aspartate/D-glutamate deacylase